MYTTFNLQNSAFVNLKTHLEEYLYRNLSAMGSYFNKTF